MIELSMVSGSGFESAYALVVLAEDLRPKLQQKEVRSEVEKTLAELLSKVNQEIADYERLKMLVVAAQPWSIENGCLTPTMKIKRSHIEYSVQHELDNWYANSKVVIWT
jgi:long-subunit acyl-CoA synthetase (AMP-forming)